MCNFGFQAIPLNRAFLNIFEWLLGHPVPGAAGGGLCPKWVWYLDPGWGSTAGTPPAGGDSGNTNNNLSSSYNKIQLQIECTQYSLSYNFWRVVSDQTINQRGGWLLIFLHWIDCRLFCQHSISKFYMHLRWLYSYGLMVCRALGQYLSLFEA